MARKTTAARDNSTASGMAARPARSSSTRRATRPARPEAPAEVVEFLESSAASAPASPPTHGEIALLAFSYWEARGCQGGSAEEDWTRAERELAARVMTANA